MGLAEGDEVDNPGLPVPESGLLDMDSVPPALDADMDGVGLVLGNGL